MYRTIFHVDFCHSLVYNRIHNTDDWSGYMKTLKCKKIVASITVIGFTVFGIIHPNSVNEVFGMSKQESKCDTGCVCEIVDVSKKPTMKDKQLEEDFLEFASQNEGKNKIFNMSFEEYCYMKENNIKFNAEDYVVYISNTYEEIEKEPAYPNNLSNGISTFSSGSGGSTYYYNTGLGRPQKSDYTRYHLLNNVKAGDLVYEPTGGAGITGHIAIVEGKFVYDKKPYIRLIEATPAYGVARGIVDDVRVDEHKVVILRVATSAKNKEGSVAFAVSQRGKGYVLDFKKDTSKNEKDWYCSELVWAAYKSQGVNLETSLGEPGITPHDIYNSELTYGVGFKYATK